MNSLVAKKEAWNMYIDKLNIELIAITPDAESLIEKAARVCYNSGENKNNGLIIERCIKNGHLSILEHANATFHVKGISRACSHQFVRHRLMSFSQKSQRYVEETGFGVIVPPRIIKNDEMYKHFVKYVQLSESAYKLYRENEIRKEDARFCLPNAISTELIFTANFRELRHILQLRTKRDAQWEIRRMCFEVLNILVGKTLWSFKDIYKNATAELRESLEKRK
jgi:thymidylate synthase (FAD)